MAYVGIKRVARRLGPVVLAAAMALTAASAVRADDATQTAAAPGNAQAPSPWIKECAPVQSGQAPVCITQQDKPLSLDGSLRVSFSIQPTSDPKKYAVSGFVPLGFVLPVGAVLNVDGKAFGTAQFVLCNGPLPQQQLPPGCIIQAQVGDDFFQAIRKGNVLNVVVTNTQNQQLPIPLSLAGFAKTYDGQGVDPVAARAQAAAQSKPLQDAAQAAAQRLLDKQQQAGGTAPAQ
jgi:invasion protein IalB